MGGTRERILEAARLLFNERGVQTTTLRQIASHLEMSQGNLNYHFRTKQEILESLYFELVEKMDAEMEHMTQGSSVMALLYESAGKSMTIFFQYRFLMRDMYLIYRENEKIKKHYLGLQGIRKTQFLGLFQSMIQQGQLREEEFADEYARLYQRVNILGDNWINAAELFQTAEAVDYYQKLLFEVIYPYLTKEGRAEYLDVIHT